jgi:nucleotide-binding universal stress UspA family protein
MTSGAIVVGVSPTSGSPAALRWAAEEARLRAAPLRAVMAWRPPRPPAAPGGRPPAGLPAADDDPESDARARLQDFVRDALGADGANAAVDCVVVKGGAVNALRSAARDAQLLVIGEARAGRLNSVRSGLVAPKLVVDAGCPVVVMPPADHRQ